VIVSNESREVNAFRSSKFALDKLSDCFISSSFVHMRKPDVEIFQLALDWLSAAENAIFMTIHRCSFRLHESLGIQGILHTDCKSTRAKLSHLGLNAE